jgi:hypothetical protein
VRRPHFGLSDDALWLGACLDVAGLSRGGPPMSAEFLRAEIEWMASALINVMNVSR